MLAWCTCPPVSLLVLGALPRPWCQCSVHFLEVAVLTPGLWHHEGAREDEEVGMCAKEPVHSLVAGLAHPVGSLFILKWSHNFLALLPKCTSVTEIRMGSFLSCLAYRNFTSCYHCF